MRRNLDALAAEDFDLLVIGGGITGGGAALDAALRGLRVAVIDKGDFASGTSSVSSKLIHGGLRYLEHGDFGLVYESLHERRRLLRNAAHLVHPLRFVLPFYDGARVPPWKQRVGLTLYDLLAGPDNLRRSRAYPLARLHRDYPALQTQGLRGGAEFFDAQMDDARLCIEVMRTAASQGAVVANYVEAAAFEKKEGLIRGVRALCRSDG
jgi:glycerol-3-phosphate dehydrogenase